MLPDLPTMLTVYGPGAVLNEAVNVIEVPVFEEFVEKVVVRPDGRFATLNVTVPVKPFPGQTEMGYAEEEVP